MKILPSITTIFNWRGKIEEIKKLGLEEAALFLTSVNLGERQEIFRLLKETKINKIPLVHLRSDNETQELDYLIKNYYTKVFNMHTKREYPYFAGYEKYKDMIYIENTYGPLDEKELKNFAGICLDLAHLENSRLFKPEKYKHDIKLIEKYKCGCNHISPAKNFSLFKNKAKEYPEEPHIMKNLSELDYLKRYPSRYFGEYVAIEMENSIKEQLEAREYIIKLLGI